MSLLEEETEAAALSTRVLEELLREQGFELADVRGRILRGEAAATPSLQKTMEAHPKGALMSGAVTPLASAEVDALRHRLEAAEVRMASMAVPHEGGPLAGALKAQPAALVEGMKKQDSRGSTIRVEPRVTWPKLGDDGTGGREVEEFYDKLEEIHGLADSGRAMTPKKQLVALKACLHGSRKRIYDSIVRSHRGQEMTDALALDIYVNIKARLMQFTETLMERQLRLRRECDALTKGRHTTALQFEAA